MVNLVDRELKFFFTSPLFIGLELAPVALIAVLIYNRLYTSLFPIIWVIIILYSTFFELEIWRREFLNKGFKLKLYVNTSEYTLFLAHSVVSLILLELKTLMVLMPLTQFLAGNFLKLAFFLLATHGNWLFSLSAGKILSKDVFRKLAGSTAVFLCMLIFSAIAILVVIPHIQSSSPSYWPNISPILSDATELTGPDWTVLLIVLFLSSLLYVLALYVGLPAVRNIRIDDI